MTDFISHKTFIEQLLITHVVTSCEIPVYFPQDLVFSEVFQ